MMADELTDPRDYEQRQTNSPQRPRQMLQTQNTKGHEDDEREHAEREQPRHGEIVEHTRCQHERAPVEERGDLAHYARHRQGPKQSDEADYNDRHTNPVQSFVRWV